MLGRCVAVTHRSAQGGQCLGWIDKVLLLGIAYESSWTSWELLSWWECSSCACVSFMCFSALLPQIMADLLANGIDVYPQKEFDEDSEDRLVNEKFRVSAWAWGLGVLGWALQIQRMGMSWEILSKGPIFSFKTAVPLSGGSAQDQGSCQSSEHGQEGGEEGTWGRCPLTFMLLLLPSTLFLNGTFNHRRTGRSQCPLLCPGGKECQCLLIPG